MINKKDYFKNYYSLNDLSLGFFLNNIKDNIEEIKKHKNVCLINQDLFINIKNKEDLFNELQFHIFYFNILEFKNDLITNKDEIDNFNEEWQNFIKNSNDFNNLFNEKTFKYNNEVFKIIVNNWNLIEKNLTREEKHHLLTKFFQKNFWKNKTLISKNINIVENILDYILLKHYGYFMPENFNNLNSNLKKIVIKNIKNDMKLNLLNKQTLLEELEIYLNLKNDYEYVEKSIIKILEDSLLSHSTEKFFIIKKIDMLFSKTKINNSINVKNKINELEKTIKKEELNLIEFPEIIPDDLDIDYNLIEKTIINDLKKEKLIFYHIISSELKRRIEKGAFAHIYDTGTFSITQNDQYKTILYIQSKIYERFFTINFNERKQYYNQLNSFIRVIAWKLNFTIQEFVLLKTWINSIFDLYTLSINDDNLYQFDGILFCTIQTIELLLKKIYIFSNSSNSIMSLLSGSKILYNDSDSKTKIYSFNELKYISNETIVMLYWFLYLKIEGNGLNIRNRVMHGEIYELMVPEVWILPWIKIIIFYLVEEIFRNIIIEGYKLDGEGYEK